MWWETNFVGLICTFSSCLREKFKKSWARVTLAPDFASTNTQISREEIAYMRGK